MQPLICGVAGIGTAARADFDKAIELAPGDPDLLISRRFLRLKDGDSKGAVADAEAAVAGFAEGSFDRLQAASLYMRGWARRASGNVSPEYAKQSAADMAAAKAIDADVADQFSPYGIVP